MAPATGSATITAPDGIAIGNIGKRREAVTGGHAAEGCCDANPNQKPRSHDTSRIAWAKLLARVGEEFPLECLQADDDRDVFQPSPDDLPVIEIHSL